MQILTVPKIVSGLMFMACASSANTLFRYQISFDATSGPIQSFSASFVSQNLLTGSSNAAFAFDPFTITDGTNSWVMAQGIASVSRGGGECLNFGTLTSFVFSCGVENFSDHEGGFLVFFSNSLPSRPGTFTPDDIFGDFTIDPNTVENFGVPGNGSFTFEITQVPVPEPISLRLFVIGLAAISWKLRRGYSTFRSGPSRNLRRSNLSPSKSRFRSRKHA